MGSGLCRGSGGVRGWRRLSSRHPGIDISTITSLVLPTGIDPTAAWGRPRSPIEAPVELACAASEHRPGTVGEEDEADVAVPQ